MNYPELLPPKVWCIVATSKRDCLPSHRAHTRGTQSHSTTCLLGCVQYNAVYTRTRSDLASAVSPCIVLLAAWVYQICDSCTSPGPPCRVLCNYLPHPFDHCPLLHCASSVNHVTSPCMSPVQLTTTTSLFQFILSFTTPNPVWRACRGALPRLCVPSNTC